MAELFGWLAIASNRPSGSIPTTRRPGLAGLSETYTTIGYYGLARPEASMPKALEAARRAVTLNPSLPEAHNALAIASLAGAWDKEQAEREFLHALELNPRYTQARSWYAHNYLQLSAGRLEEGVVQAKLTLQLDPLSSYANAVYGLTCIMAGQYAEALPTTQSPFQNQVVLERVGLAFSILLDQ